MVNIWIELISITTSSKHKLSITTRVTTNRKLRTPTLEGVNWGERDSWAEDENGVPANQTNKTSEIYEIQTSIDDIAEHYGKAQEEVGMKEMIRNRKCLFLLYEEVALLSDNQEL